MLETSDHLAQTMWLRFKQDLKIKYTHEARRMEIKVQSQRGGEHKWFITSVHSVTHECYTIVTQDQLADTDSLSTQIVSNIFLLPNRWLLTISAALWRLARRCLRWNWQRKTDISKPPPLQCFLTTFFKLAINSLSRQRTKVKSHMWQLNFNQIFVSLGWTTAHRSSWFSIKRGKADIQKDCGHVYSHSERFGGRQQKVKRLDNWNVPLDRCQHVNTLFLSVHRYFKFTPVNAFMTVTCANTRTQTLQQQVYTKGDAR